MQGKGYVAVIKAGGAQLYLGFVAAAADATLDKGVETQISLQMMR